MREKWILETKRADFETIAGELGVLPVVVRCMVNRGMDTVSKMKQYLYGTRDDLHDPYLMKDMRKAETLLHNVIQEGKKIAIASDFDCDGIFSGYLLLRGFERLGADACIYTPDRVREGYGLNERIVDEAYAAGRTVLVTCDNGIAAIEEISYAKKKGMTVIVTDHHEVQECVPEADAVLDPKQEDDGYPFDGLCGAGVAFKLMDVLYRSFHLDEEEKWSLLPYTAIATVADVMELQGENRIIVKEGLKMLPSVENVGLRELLKALGLQDKQITPSHVGFAIGPCFNATGRIADVRESFALLMEDDPVKAEKQAVHLMEVNEARKAMTEEGVRQAVELVDRQGGEKALPSVPVLLLTDIHESLAGIIAGRLKERYHHPVIVFTETGEGLVKGSGRSIEAYDMFAELMKCRDLMVRFGGHKMAAGMTLQKEDLPELRERLQKAASLTEEDFRPIVRIDAAPPVGYLTKHLIDQLVQMEPFGTGNPKPIFAEQHFRVLRGRKLGREKNVLKLQVENTLGNRCEAILFHDIDRFEDFVVKEWGGGELARMYGGRENRLDIAFTYYPEWNEYGGRGSVQMKIISYCRVGGEKRKERMECK